MMAAMAIIHHPELPTQYQRLLEMVIEQLGNKTIFASAIFVLATASLATAIPQCCLRCLHRPVPLLCSRRPLRATTNRCKAKDKFIKCCRQSFSGASPLDRSHQRRRSHFDLRFVCGDRYNDSNAASSAQCAFNR